MGSALRNHYHTALAYAATKLLNTMVEDAGELPPGCCIDVGGGELTIIIPQGVTVEKAEGKDGDGVRPTKATTNLNGWYVLAVLLEVCRKFKQHNVTETELLDAVENAVANVGGTTADELAKNDPGLPEIVEAWKKRLGPRLPKRQETTRRYVKQETAAQATVIIGKAKSVAA